MLVEVLDTGRGLTPGVDSRTLFDPAGTSDWSTQRDASSIPQLGVLAAPPPRARHDVGGHTEFDPGTSAHRARLGHNFGLPIVDRLVRLMGGSAGLCTARGHTVFWVTIPYTEPSPRGSPKPALREVATAAPIAPEDLPSRFGRLPTAEVYTGGDDGSILSTADQTSTTAGTSVAVGAA